MQNNYPEGYFPPAIISFDSSLRPKWGYNVRNKYLETLSAGIDNKGNINLLLYYYGDTVVNFGAKSYRLSEKSALLLATENSTGSTGDLLTIAVPADSNSDLGQAQLYIDGQNNKFITGSFSGSIKFGKITLTASTHSLSSNLYISEGFIAKYDRNNTLIWVKTRISGGHYIARDIATDRSGNIYVFSNFDVKIYFKNDSIRSYGPLRATDPCLTKYSPTGEPVWTKVFGGIGDDYAYKMHLDALDNIYVSGGFSGGIKISDTTIYSGYRSLYLAKFDSSGQYKWLKPFYYQDSLGDIYGGNFNILSSNKILMSGIFTRDVQIDTVRLKLSSKPGDDTLRIPKANSFLALLDTGGKLIKATQLGGPGSVHVNDIASKGDKIYISGYFHDSIWIGSRNYRYAAKGSNMYIAQLCMNDFIGAISEVSPNTSLEGLKLYPNPAQSELQLSYTLSEAGRTHADTDHQQLRADGQ